MRVLMIGCDYAGKTTLANQITSWIKETMGGVAGWHDHFTLPDVGQGPNHEKEADAIVELLEKVPALVEKFQRFQFVYHIQPTIFARDDFLVVNWYYADSVYVPIYFPQVNTYNRQHLARFIEFDLKVLAPDIILVQVKASPEIIKQRMRQEPRPRYPFKEQDVELVLNRFEEEFNDSILDAKITIDTTTMSAAETMRDFVRKVEPYLQPVDRQRILAHQALKL